MNIHYLPPQKKLKPIHPEKHKRVAFHAAGQATAICLRNKRMELPTVFFRLSVNQSNPMGQKSDNFEVKVDGGQLIETLPASLTEVIKEFSLEQKLYYEKAFAADVVNILAGSVAEAKYVAQRDNEIITPRLVNFNSLRFYNGLADTAKVLDYVKCLALSPEKRRKWMIEVYLTSYSFVNEYKIWEAITRLANHILQTGKAIIDADEVMAVLDDEDEDKPKSRVMYKALNEASR